MSAIPDELVGLEPPTSYITALFTHTAKMDRAKAEMEVSKAHEVSAPVDTLSRQIKAMSLFPNIYRGEQHHRTFPSVKTDDNDGENYYKKRPKNMKVQVTSF